MRQISGLTVRASYNTSRLARYRYLLVGLFIAAVLLVGCGGSDPRITGADKDKISRAALTISMECIANGPGADASKVESAVNELLNARDKFGDQRFTISDTIANVTVQDVMDRQARLMRENECAPEQAKRMSG